jgi:UDP-glucose:(heptosyl)LPS alpha-1,3-glucosyltransferase
MNKAERRLKIAFVVHDYNRHMGHSRYVAELATRFKRGHEVHVFANTFEESDPAGIIYHHVPAWRTNALASILSFVLPATALVRGPFDIVHAQGLCGLRQNVITAHICQPAWFEAAGRYAGRPAWRKWVFRELVTRLDRLVMRPRAAARFIAPSERVCGELDRHYRLTEQVRVVRHGTDIAAFHPRNRARWRGAVRAELGLRDSDFVALYVGDLQKAMPAAIRAVARTADVHLVAVSPSDPGPYARLATAERIAGRVRFLPPTAQVERYYAAADVFLFPTYYDAFGLVVAEAMATGLPVITSRAAGAAELIEHGESGWLTADPWDPDQIVEGLRALAVDPALRERMGAAARSRIEAYTWDRAAEQTLAVYREVFALANHSHPSEGAS